MKKFLLFITLFAAASFVSNEASAQIKAGEGQVTIALESNNSYYTKDRTEENRDCRKNEGIFNTFKKKYLPVILEKGFYVFKNGW